jgi:dihydropteroate synthase
MEGQVSTQAQLGGIAVGAHRPVCVIGAINVSPESFYSASVARGRKALAQRAAQMVADGAAIIDLGAMSTAPYRHTWIDAAEELRRLLPALEVVRDAVGVPVSVDTQRAAVAAAALDAGASIINDISGLGADKEMGAVARRAAGVILMARETGPSTLAPIAVVSRLLRACLRRAQAARLLPRRIVLDPGIGFFRQGQVPWDQFDCAVLHDLGKLTRLGHPLLVGVSRKSFIGRLTGRADPAERLSGSVAAAAVAVMNGAHLIRAHDVAATVDAVRVAEAIRDGVALRRPAATRGPRSR